MGGGEGVLNGVLGLLAGAEHVPAERQDPRHVALVDDLEGGLAALPDAVDQVLVARAARAGAWTARGARPLDGCR